MRYVASVSFGKDSLAMLLRLIAEEKPLDEVVFYDTGAEFDCIYRIRDFIVANYLIPLSIKYTELKNKKELLAYYKHLPNYWERLKMLQARTNRPFKKNKTIFDFDKEFSE